MLSISEGVLGLLFRVKIIFQRKLYNATNNKIMIVYVIYRGKQQNGKDYRDLFKKIRDTKGTFHAKMGSIKGRNIMDLTDRKSVV